MAEVLLEYEATIRDESGREYVARACGRECDDGHWEGWLEFVPLDGGIVARTARETTQPNRTETAYWATGLTAVYLQGALRRALDPVQVVERSFDIRPIYDAPAPERPLVSVSGARAFRAHPVLNPFLVYEQGEDVLRSELGALDAGRLRDIIRGYSLRNDTAELMRTSEAELADIIVSSVRERFAAGSVGEKGRQNGIVSAEG